MKNNQKEKVALFAFSFVILAIGGPCGFMDQYMNNEPDQQYWADNQTSGPTHLGCQNEACVMISGSGTNECTSDYDCIQAPANSHAICQNSKCVEVSGSGSDECTYDSECAPLIPNNVSNQPTQAECSTLAGSCNSCLSKAGCGWCKTSNSCFVGTANGPSVSSCISSDWVVSVNNCAAPAGGSSCSSQTNCANCLTGSGCKWCIQGSKCTDSSSADSCFGGWLSQSYQCNFASR